MSIYNSASFYSSINLIPVDLLGDRIVFDIVLNDNNLWSLINQSKKDELLSKYFSPSLTKEEKEETIELLLNNNLIKFNENLIDNIFIQLKLQRLSPDLLKILEEVKYLKNKARQIQEQEYQCKLLKEVIIKRKNFFNETINLCPDDFFKPFRWTKFENKCSLRRYRKWQKHLKKKRKIKQRYDFEMKQLFLNDNETTDEDIDTFFGICFNLQTQRR